MFGRVCLGGVKAKSVGLNPSPVQKRVSSSDGGSAGLAASYAANISRLAPSARRRRLLGNGHAPVRSIGATCQVGNQYADRLAWLVQCRRGPCDPAGKISPASTHPAHPARSRYRQIGLPHCVLNRGYERHSRACRVSPRTSTPGCSRAETPLRMMQIVAALHLQVIRETRPRAACKCQPARPAAQLR